MNQIETAIDFLEDYIPRKFAEKQMSAGSYDADHLANILAFLKSARDITKKDAITALADRELGLPVGTFIDHNGNEIDVDVHIFRDEESNQMRFDTRSGLVVLDRS